MKYLIIVICLLLASCRSVEQKEAHRKEVIERRMYVDSVYQTLSREQVNRIKTEKVVAKVLIIGGITYVVLFTIPIYDY